MGTTLCIAGHPSADLSVALYRDVQQSKQLQEQVVAGSLPADCAIINAALLPDLFLLRLAAEAALQAHQRGKLKTRSLHAELVYNLSGSRHITESLRRFGISEAVSHVLIARYGATAEEMTAVGSVVKGEAMPLDALPGLANLQLIRKYHKVGEEELKIGSLVDAVACHMATRDVL